MVKFIPAALVTVVGRDPALGALPPPIVAFIITPPELVFIWGITKRHILIVDINFRFISSSQFLSVTSSNKAAAEAPALLTKISTFLNLDMVCSTRFLQSSALLTSA